MNEKLETIVSTVIPYIKDNVDTDQIIPARFLKITTKAGLGEHLFEDLRYAQQGKPNPEFILNQPAAKSAKILLTGENFGCGSSREHAPWALQDFGFQAIIARSFADIFRNNAVKNGILPVCLDESEYSIMQDTLQEIPDMMIHIDIAGEIIYLPTGEKISFSLDPFTKHCFINGMDDLQYLISRIEVINAYETGILKE